MKIVVIGGTGLIGSKVVANLKQKGHEVLAAAPNTGINTITGEGLKEAMTGTQGVIDLANSPSFEDKAVWEFFEALCTAGICLDVVGLQYELIPSGEMKTIVAEFPRLGMKSRMTRCFCGIARSHPQTTYDNFARDFGERFVPGYKAPSAVDFVANTPFDE